MLLHLKCSYFETNTTSVYINNDACYYFCRKCPDVSFPESMQKYTVEKMSNSNIFDLIYSTDYSILKNNNMCQIDVIPGVTSKLSLDMSTDVKCKTSLDMSADAMRLSPHYSNNYQCHQFSVMSAGSPEAANDLNENYHCNKLSMPSNNGINSRHFTECNDLLFHVKDSYKSLNSRGDSSHIKDSFNVHEEFNTDHMLGIVNKNVIVNDNSSNVCSTREFNKLISTDPTDRWLAAQESKRIPIQNASDDKTTVASDTKSEYNLGNYIVSVENNWVTSRQKSPYPLAPPSMIISPKRFRNFKN